MSSPSPEDEPSAEAAAPEAPEAIEDTDLSSSTPITPAKATDAKDEKPKATPNSAPAASRPRARTSAKKPEPTLLHDFLKGRPSPARVAAERRRRMSLEAVKAELRHEMRQSAVKRVQPPGGVKDRVKKWQKANAAAMEDGADDAATEPTEVAFNSEEFRSVTEEDRVRIKMRKKVKAVNKSKESLEAKAAPPPEEPARPPPKKRVVSDEHWRKNRPSRRVSKNGKGPGPAPLPKDFTIRNSTNPTVSSKVKKWAEKVEVPDTPPPRSHRYPRSAGWTDTESELWSDLGETASEATPSHVTSSRVTQRTSKSASAADDGIRVTPIRKPKSDDDGIRVRPCSEISSATGTSRPASVRTARLRRKSAHTSRRTSPQSERTKLTEETTKEPEESKEVPKKEPKKEPKTAPKKEVKKEEPKAKSPPPAEVIDEDSNLSKTTKTESNITGTTEEREPAVDTPTKRRSVSGSKRRPKPKGQRPKPKEPESILTEEETNLDSQLEPSELSSSLMAKSLADIPGGEIPFGNSAFTELDLPLRGPPRSRPIKRPPPPKVDRNTSFKGIGVFKKVVEEGKKIIHEMNEPPRHAVPNNPPSIEKWLNNTVEVSSPADPFVDDAGETPATPARKEPSPESDHSPETVTSVEKKPRRQATRGPKGRPSQKLERTESKKSPEPVTEEPEDKPEPKPKPKPTPKTTPKAEPEPEKTPEPKRDPREQTKSPGLHRSRATRSPVNNKPPGVKKQLFGMLKEAFQGESVNQLPKPKPYRAVEEREYEDEESELTYDSYRHGDSRYEDSRYDDDSRLDDSRLDDSRCDESVYTDSRYTEYRYDDDRAYTYEDAIKDWESSDPRKNHNSRGSRSVSPEEERDRKTPRNDQPDLQAPRMPPGPRLKPPTNGHHELSTILSEGHSSAAESDTNSNITRSTITQSTIITKGSELSRSGSQSSGLKRRLTRHSDLVSVLSLPDDRNVPSTMKSNRSRPSLRRNRGGPNDVTNDDLMKEFADDENLYLRELKTLVDGVIPVLLAQVLDEDNASEIFGSSNKANRVTGISKSVVNMGVALEKLRQAHCKAPVSDMRRLASWAHGVVPIYHKYLDAWRLGFQDLVVNLAPAAGNPDDEDSLVNAMPRNEYGDIVDAQGERVDVAHLLKRPLLRIKQMTKFIKCIDSIIKTEDTDYLLGDFEDLQEKARRRHREESARLVDEDAINTDTTRSRDLRTLAPMDFVYIETTRQVAAKDFFSLDLAHSNGQRLECQVELVHRDSERHPDDKGDLLIRETGGGHRSFLLFPPIPVELMSARTGDGTLDMVIMVSGSHDDRPWFELLTLTADNEDQILDWLDIFPVSPIPPRQPEPSVCGDDEGAYKDVPVGVRGSSRRSPRSSRSPQDHSSPGSPASPNTPTKQPSRHRRRPSTPTTPPTIPESPEWERTPTQDRYHSSQEDASVPLREGMRPDPGMFQNSSNSSPCRNDGAPAPPVHRTLTPSPSPSPQPSSKSQSLSPPVDLKGGRLKRRNSSPLKHEYLPSEQSSVTGNSYTEDEDISDEYTETESDVESSDDEMESADLPETELGFSIQPEQRRPAPLVESVVSDFSLTPSNSASQAGLHGHKDSTEDINDVNKYVASLSKWSDKGMWKDISAGNCNIVVTPGLIEAFAMNDGEGDKPILALDLTPLVLIRQSTAVDLEIRSSVRSGCIVAKSHNGGNFRFRCVASGDCYNLYMSVHHARLNNQKFIELENETRFKSFGERQRPQENDDTSSRRRSWFGRKNSYRSSVRAPEQSHDGASTTPSSSLSATSFLKRLTGGANLPFNLARSSVDRQSRASGYGNSLYTPGSSSNGMSTPRSPSVSVENSARSSQNYGSENIRIRLHLLVSAKKWEDFGNCSLQVRRPPPGWRQALRADHGMEKRVTVTTMPKKDSEKPKILLDAVLGSGCFTPMGSRGIVCGIWEEMKGDNGVVGAIPTTGASNGNVKKWCFQCSSVSEASWVLRLLHQEVFTA